MKAMASMGDLIAFIHSDDAFTKLIMITISMATTITTMTQTTMIYHTLDKMLFDAVPHLVDIWKEACMIAVFNISCILDRSHDHGEYDG